MDASCSSRETTALASAFSQWISIPVFQGKILAYDPTHDRWSEAGDTPAPRATVPAVEWNGAFVIPSGEVRPGVRSPEVFGPSKRGR
jgi:N-acetylneuraminic acid mutarotase